eukprot:115185-Hanusia_phi.AAC.1
MTPSGVGTSAARLRLAVRDYLPAGPASQITGPKPTVRSTLTESEAAELSPALSLLHSDDSFTESSQVDRTGLPGVLAAAGLVRSLSQVEASDTIPDSIRNPGE